MAAADPRRALADVWAFRAHAEQGARVRFAAMEAMLRRCRADDAVVRAARSASDDERRHEGICRRLADALGGAPDPDTEGPPDLAEPGWTLEQRVTFALVASCCVTESINAAVLGEALARSEEPSVRSALREILRDEVIHARLGWAHLASARSRIDLGYIGPLLPRVFEQTFRPTFFEAISEPQPFGEALGARWGVLSRGLSLIAVRGVMGEAVLPGLDAFGVDTSAARIWWGARNRDTEEPRDAPSPTAADDRSEEAATLVARGSTRTL